MRWKGALGRISNIYWKDIPPTIFGHFNIYRASKLFCSFHCCFLSLQHVIAMLHYELRLINFNKSKERNFTVYSVIVFRWTFLKGNAKNYLVFYSTDALFSLWKKKVEFLKFTSNRGMLLTFHFTTFRPLLLGLQKSVKIRVQLPYILVVLNPTRKLFLDAESLLPSQNLCVKNDCTLVQE